LDLNSIDSMIDFHEERPATGLTILGIMGAVGKLSPKESSAVFVRVISHTDLPAIVGLSAAGMAPMQAVNPSPTICLMPICRWSATKASRDLAWQFANTFWPGAVRSSTKPCVNQAQSSAPLAEIDTLMAR